MGGAIGGTKGAQCKYAVKRVGSLMEDCSRCCLASDWDRGPFSGVTCGRGAGAECPSDVFTGKILLTYRETRVKEKMEMEKERRKIVKGKVKNLKSKFEIVWK